MKNNVYTFGGLGLLSGVINACIFWVVATSTISTDFPLLSSIEDVMWSFLFYFAGITYGLITIPLFSLKSRKTIFLWVLTTTASYAIAVQVATHLSDGGDLIFSEPDPIAFGFGGFIGAFIIAIGIHCLIQKLNLFQYFLLLIVGATVPILLSLLRELDESFDENFIVMMYILWQTCLTLAIYTISTKRKYPENPLSVL